MSHQLSDLGLNKLLYYLFMNRGCKTLDIFKGTFQRRAVLYWKYSLNTRIFSKSLKSNSVPLNKNVYHLWNSHNISLYKCRGCCKPIFSKGYTGSQVDVINIAASPLWIQLIPLPQCKPRVPMAHFGSIFFLAKFPDNIYSICILWPNLRCVFLNRWIMERHRGLNSYLIASE